MNLILITAFIAVCGAAKLDRTYLPPSAASAGGSPGSLHTPLTRTSEEGKSNTPLESHTSPGSSNAPLTRTSEQGTFNNPSGSYTNDFGGVVVEAAAPGTRSSEGISGLGSPRLSYGTSNSKVGDAAFRNSAGFRGFEATGQLEQSAGQLHNRNSFQISKAIDNHSAQRFPSIEQVNTQTQFSYSDNENRSERPQAAKDRSSNILSISNDVNVDSYSYGFETDNGIVVDENGVDINGLQAEGGYSYQGDDGKVYKVTYVADEKGYRPQGAHLPTPPPIPKEILKSLEQNAKDEAAGLVDDGSYDAQKYNAESDYTHDNSDNNQHNGGQSTQLVKRPVSTFNQNNKAFVAESPNSGFNSQDVNEQSSQASGNADIRKPYTISSQENPGQHGISQTSYNGQSQVNRQHGSAQFESQAHSAFGQTNQFNYNSDVAKNEYNSHSSQSSNGNAGSTGQADEKLGNRFSSSVQNQDAIGSPSQIGSQFGQSALPSGQFQSQPYQSGSRRQDNFGQASSLSTPSTNKYSKISLDSSSSSSLPESGTSFKPQGSEAFSGASLNQNQDAQDFGKPFPQMFSGENFNRPASGNFNKPQTGQNQVNRGSVTYNRLSQSGQLVAQKEYLPPYNNSPLPTKSQVSDLTIQSSGLESQNNNIPNFVPLNRPKPNFASATASTSFNQPQTNAFDTKPKLNQFTQQIGSTQQSSQLSSEYNTKAQESAFASQTVSDISTKPTTVPDTDLTTPLEPNENSKDPQFSSKTTSNFGQFGSKLNQGKTQFELQGNSAFGQSTSEILSHSTSSVKSQLSTATQPAFQSSIGTGSDNSNVPQFPQNSFSQSQSSTQVDDSYYYNQPSKAFGPGMRHQGPGFSNSPSYQSNGVVQNQFLNQQRFQTFAPVQPTAATQLPSRQSQGYSGITQAAISSFPSLPTQSSQAVMTHSQFGSGFNQQSSIGNQNLPGAQPSNIQQTTISSNQKIENQKPLISNLPIGRYPPGSQLDNPGNQIHSTGMKHTNNQQPNNGNTQDINIHMTGQLSNQQTIPSLPMRRFPPNLQFGLVGNQAPLTRVKPSYNQSSFSNTAVTTADLFGKLQTGQPASTFSQTETQFEISKTSEPLESSSQSTQTQQYQGTIYEYNKPAEVLPVAQTDSSSGQISISSESKPSLEQSLSSQSFSEQNLKQFSQNDKINNSGFSAQSNKGESSSSSFQFGQQAQAQNIQGSPVSQSEDFEVQPAKPFNAPSTNGQFSQSSQSGKPYGALSASVKFAQTGQLTKDDSTLQNNLGQSDQSFKPFGSGQSSQSPFVTKTQFGKQTGQFSQTQTTQSFGTAQPEQISSQFQSSMQNSESAEGNGYFYPRKPKPQFVEQTQFHSEPSRTQASFMSNQFNSAQPINSQSNSYNHQSQFSATPQFGFDTNKNIQATFGQRQTNTNQQFESQYPLASSQAFASGQGIASASASTSNPKPFSSHDRTQFSQTELNSYDQSGQGTQVGAQSAKPFGNQDSKPQSSRPFGTSPQGSKLFKSACCQAYKDSSSHQTDGPTSSFPGAISNSQAFAGKGEVFGGPRKPPMFDDQTGYHY